LEAWERLQAGKMAGLANGAGWMMVARIPIMMVDEKSRGLKADETRD
jgi:hypothetical protein